MKVCWRYVGCEFLDSTKTRKLRFKAIHIEMINFILKYRITELRKNFQLQKYLNIEIYEI